MTRIIPRPNFRVVEPAPVDPAEAIRQMQAQATEDATSYVTESLDLAEELVRRMAVIGTLGAAVHPGVRDAARRLGDATSSHAITLKQIMGKVR